VSPRPRRPPWRTSSPLWSAVAVVLLLGSFFTNAGQPENRATTPAGESSSSNPSAPRLASPSTARAEPGAEPSPSVTSPPAPTSTPAQPLSPTPTPTNPSPLPTSSGSAYSEALALVDTLAVKGRAPKTGYDREGQFGNAWRDVDRNGCDTRNDILLRDLTDRVVDDNCRVLTGTLLDPYTGTTIAFVRGVDTSAEVQIDHVVALLNAWETGAQQLSLDERIRFANDPLNLRAVDGQANAQKGAGDAATWLPPNRAIRCDYVSWQVQVKARYALWVTVAERDAMVRVLSECYG
jgi:hypothetical protein